MHIVKKLFCSGLTMALGLLATTQIYAQKAPGGTNLTLELWLAADKANGIGYELPPDGAKAFETYEFEWIDLSPQRHKFKSPNPTKYSPLFHYNGMNYNPCVTFPYFWVPETNTSYNNDGSKLNLRKLVSDKNFTIDPNKTYYTFWVSRVDPAPSAANATVFAFNNNQNNSVGWHTSTSSPYTAYIAHSTNHTATGLTSGVGYYSHYSVCNANIGTTVANKWYGIGTAVQTNAIPSAYQYQYHNGHGERISPMMQMVTSNSSGRPIIGSTSPGLNSGDAVNYFYGDIQEIIVLSAPAGSIIDADLNKNVNMVHSYLAIKYGQTMFVGMSTNFTFYNSDYQEVWKASDNTDYANYIFGIGRDDATGLNQKQSCNVDRGYLTVFLGDRLCLMNVLNNTFIADKTYAMFGSNSGDINDFSTQCYNFPAGANFSNGSIGKEITKLSACTYRTQVTKDGVADSITVSMQYKADGYYVLVSAAPITETSSSSDICVYPMDNKGIARKIKLRAGDYIRLAQDDPPAPIASTHYPANVGANLRMWLKPDYSSMDVRNDAYGTSITQWKDEFRGLLYEAPNTRRLDNVNENLQHKYPTYVSSSPKMNFHPAAHFRRQGYYLRAGNYPMMNAATPNDVTFFTVANVTTFGEHIGGTDNTTKGFFSYFMGFGSSETPNFVATGGDDNARKPSFGIAVLEDRVAGVGRFWSNVTSMNGTKRLFTAGSTGAMMHSYKKNTFYRYEIDGTAEQLPLSGSVSVGNNSVMNSYSYLGAASRRERNTIGYISEIIVYEGQVAVDDKDKIMSYLGMKYGITLKDESNSTAGYDYGYDYKLSDGESVWPGKSDLRYRRFHHNVAMVVRDDAAELMNPLSHSTDVGDFVTIGVNGTFLDKDGYNDVTGFQEDKKVIAWGHDGKPYSADPNHINELHRNESVCGLMDFYANRKWMITKNFTGNQQILIGIGGDVNTFPQSTPNYEIVLLFASDTTKLNNKQWDQVVATTYKRGIHQAIYTLVGAKNTFIYFTIGVKNLIGKCETCDFGNIRKVGFTTQNWSKGANSRSFVLNADGFRADVKVRISGSNSTFYSGYPRAAAGQSLSLYRRKALGDDMLATIIPSRPASVNFQIYEIDREGNAWDKVTVIGYCSEQQVMPRLTYVKAASASSYKISGNTAEAKQKPLPGYSSDAGKMNVTFVDPVDSVVVLHTAKFKAYNTDWQRIGISPIAFSCRPPLPPPSEDGFIFVETAPTEVSFCETVPFTYEIYNIDCFKRKVNFKTELPEKMVWKTESVSFYPDTAVYDNINAYEETRNLAIDSLLIPAGGSVIINGQASFKDGITPGNYSNRGTIGYFKLNGNDTIISSCSLANPSICEANTFEVLNDPIDKYIPLEAVKYILNKTLYKENDLVTIELQLNNPNPAKVISNVSLDISFNTVFTYVDGSLSATGITEPLTVVSDANFQGHFSINNFTIPIGASTINFTLRAPTKANLEKVFDINNNPLDKDGNILTGTQSEIDKKQAIFPLLVGYNFTSESNRCAESALDDANGDIEVPYDDKARAYVISNRHVTSK